MVNWLRTHADELRLYTVRLTTFEAFALALGFVTLVVANAVVLLTEVVLVVVGGVYDIFAGIFHFFTGVSISLGAFGTTLGNGILLLLSGVAILVTAGLVWGYSNQTLDGVSGSQITRPSLALVPPSAALAVADVPVVPGVVTVSTAVGFGLVVWFSVRATAYATLVSIDQGSGDGWELLGFVIGLGSLSWAAAAVTLAGYDWLGWATPLTGARSTLPLVALTPWWAFLGTVVPPAVFLAGRLLYLNGPRLRRWLLLQPQ